MLCCFFLAELRLKVTIMLQRLKHAIHVKGVSFGAMSLLLMHSWSLIPSQVNQIMHVPSTAQTAMDSLHQKYLLP